MALLGLDTERMEIVVKAGALEEYVPSDKMRALCASLESVRNKMVEWKAKEKEFFTKEVIPVLQEIKKDIDTLNEERYPELKAMREKQEAEAAAKAAPTA